MADSIKDKINEKIAGGESIGSGDFANFSQSTKKRNSESVNTATVSEEVKDDPIMNLASAELAPVNASRINLHKSGQDLGISINYDEIEITERDKTEFLDCLIDNRRFTETFSIFGGRITGVIRSRTSDESRALIYESQRRVSMGEILSDSDYAAVFRRSAMRFQVQQLNSTEYPPAEGPFLAQAKFRNFVLDDSEATAPKWYEEAETMWQGMQTGMEAAIFAEIMKFEYKYWTMVENADNQDFWNPGG